jgi:hypothetical protein
MQTLLHTQESLSHDRFSPELRAKATRLWADHCTSWHAIVGG